MIGLTSMGGAALMTPFLILVVGVRPTFAVGTDLVYAAVAKWLGAWVHWKQGTVDMALVKRLATGSLPGGALGVLGIELLKNHHIFVDNFIRQGVGVTLALVSIVILFRAIIGTELPAHWEAAFEKHQKTATVAIGAFVGFTVGFTSIGSGSLMMPALALLYALPAAKLVGTDVFHAALLVSVAAFLHWGTGNVEWDLVPWLLAGSLPGVLIGSLLAPRLPQRVLRVGLGLTLLATGAKLV